MLLLTSLSLVIQLAKLVQDNGKSQKVTGAISEMASEIYPLSISSIPFITVINLIMVLSMLHKVSSPKIGEWQ